MTIDAQDLATATTYSERLAAMVDKIRYADLPSDVCEVAQLRLLDGLAVTMAGSRSDLARVADEYIRLQASDRGRTRNVTSAETWDGQLPVEELGFVLGCWAFAYNYADTSLASVAHPGSTVIPAILAAIRGRHVSGADVLRAVAAGYEVTEAVARTLNEGPPRMGNQLKGFRPTAMGGPFGVVAVLACVWHLDQSITQRALELACSLAAGLRRQGGGSVSSIRIQSGLAVRAGISAVLLALAGVQGQREMFEGQGGFFSAYGDSATADIARTVGHEGPTWAVTSVGAKLHCTAHNLAAVLDCLILCVQRHGIDPQAIFSIDIAVPAAHAEINEQHRRAPSTFAEARNSYEFCAAVAAIHQDFLWPATLRSYLDDPFARELSERVTLRSDPELTDLFDRDAESWPARVHVTVDGGMSFSHDLHRPVGSTTAGLRPLLLRKVEMLTGDGALAAGLEQFCMEAVPDSKDFESGLLECGLLERSRFSDQGHD